MKTRVNSKTSLDVFLDLIEKNSAEDHKVIDVDNENLKAYLGVLVHYHIIHTETPEGQSAFIKKLCEIENIGKRLFTYVKQNLASIKELIEKDRYIKTIEDVKNCLSKQYHRGEMISTYVERYGNKRLCGWLFGMKSTNANRNEFVTEAQRSFQLSSPVNVNSQQQGTNDYNYKLYTLFARASQRPFPEFEYYKSTGLALTVLLVADDLNHLTLFELQKCLSNIVSGIENSLETICALMTYNPTANNDYDEYLVNVIQGFLIKEKARDALEQALLSRTSIPTIRLL